MNKRNDGGLIFFCHETSQKSVGITRQRVTGNGSLSRAVTFSVTASVSSAGGALKYNRGIAALSYLYLPAVPVCKEEEAGAGPGGPEELFFAECRERAVLAPGEGVADEEKSAAL